MKKQRGITFLEIIFALAIAAIVLSIGVPNFVQSMRNSEMVRVSNTLVNALHTARAEAVKTQSRVTMCRGTSTDTTTASCDITGSELVVFINVSDDSSFDGGDTLIAALPWLQDDHKISSATIPGYVNFSAQGFAQAVGGASVSGDIVICGAGGAEFGRVLTMTPTGRPSIKKMVSMASPPACPT